MNSTRVSEIAKACLKKAVWFSDPNSHFLVSFTASQTYMIRLDGYCVYPKMNVCKSGMWQFFRGLKPALIGSHTKSRLLDHPSAHGRGIQFQKTQQSYNINNINCDFYKSEKMKLNWVMGKVMTSLVQSCYFLLKRPQMFNKVFITVTLKMNVPNTFSNANLFCRPILTKP